MRGIALFAVLALFWAGCEAEQNNRPDGRADLTSTLRMSDVGSSDDWGTMADPPAQSLYSYDTVEVYDVATLETSYVVIKVGFGEDEGSSGGPDARTIIKGDRQSQTPNNNGGKDVRCLKDDAQTCYSSDGVVIDRGTYEGPPT